MSEGRGEWKTLRETEIGENRRLGMAMNHEDHRKLLSKIASPSLFKKKKDEKRLDLVSLH